MSKLTQEQIDMIQDLWNENEQAHGIRYPWLELAAAFNQFEDDPQSKEFYIFQDMTQEQEIEAITLYLSMFDDGNSKTYKLARQIKSKGKGVYPVADLFKFLYTSDYKTLLESFKLTPDEEKQLLKDLIDLYQKGDY